MGRRCSVGWVKAPLRGLGGSRSRGSARAPLATAGRGAVGWCGPPWQPQGPRLGADPLDASAVVVGVRGLLESVGRGPEGGTGRSHVVKLNPTVLENVCHITCGQPAAWDGSHVRQWSGRPGAAVRSWCHGRSWLLQLGVPPCCTRCSRVLEMCVTRRGEALHWLAKEVGPQRVRSFQMFVGQKKHVLGVTG